jgi:hypothetical protein
LGAELNIVMKRGSSLPSRLPSRAIKLRRINSYPHARYQVLYFTSDETLKRSFFWVILMWCEQYSNVYQMSEITLLTSMDSVCVCTLGVYLTCPPLLPRPPTVRPQEAEHPWRARRPTRSSSARGAALYSAVASFPHGMRMRMRAHHFPSHLDYTALFSLGYLLFVTATTHRVTDTLCMSPWMTGRKCGGVGQGEGGGYVAAPYALSHVSDTHCIARRHPPHHTTLPHRPS